jgi:hypothetical protein
MVRAQLRGGSDRDCKSVMRRFDSAVAAAARGLGDRVSRRDRGELAYRFRENLLEME